MVTVWSVLMLASAVVALTLATGLTVAAWGGRRDGLPTWALALALQALACGLLGWRAQWPVLWVNQLVRGRGRSCASSRWSTRLSD